MKLVDLETPSLILDPERMRRNISSLKKRLAGYGVRFRAHLKTSKSVPVARELMETHQGPATVSTLLEAEQFADAGVRDIIYAVGIAPQKLARVEALRKRGIDLAVILDNPEQARAVAAASKEFGDRVPALIEIDSDGHRSGISPGSSALIEIGKILHAGAELRGVLTHAGDSYSARGKAALIAFAEQERAAAVQCAQELMAAGLPCPIVSVGSTPTAHFGENFTGVTEVRAGVFVFFDLVMAGIGVCAIDDIAISVLATVIGYQKEKGWIIVDAGWTALSRDLGTASQEVDQGYGLVCDIEGHPYTDLIVTQTNQEHGILAIRPGSKVTLPDVPVGTMVRILPNHACATAAQHDRYHVIDPKTLEVEEIWPRFLGW